jgi:hypothetical protein
MYLDMLLLVLYQRCAVFSFGRELSHLSQRWKVHGWDTVRSAFSELRAAFGQFVNLYWYPMITNQVQGIEMYEIARRELDNAELFTELRTEMDGTWGFMESQHQARLSRWGAIAIPLALVLAFYGVSLIDKDGFHGPEDPWLRYYVPAVAVLAACFMWWGRRFGGRLKSPWKRLVSRRRWWRRGRWTQ